ncbi:MAG: glycyl-radical enzyme activating protein [Bacillota bacterium]|nr:glycyl-radical enzyme activating protein [Bacillota bacterium]
MQELKALIADIQRSSVHDGPGIRTTVFFKGCPLHCSWCHNPECISFEKQMLYYPEKCIGCGMCDKGCYSGAKVICGKETTIEEVLNQVLLDKDYYKDEGGVTFSGGEPMSQKAFLSGAIDACKAHGINTAIETSMVVYDEEIFKKLDLIMCDFKIWDDEKHKEHVGVSNEIIKENIKKLDNLGIPFIVRTPVVPGINDTKEEIESIRGFLKDFKNIIRYELLPYHPLGVSKQKALGMEIKEYEVPSIEKMKELREYADISR